MAAHIIRMPDLPSGRATAVDVDGTSVLLCHSASGLHAMRDACPHQALSMNGGRVRGESVICPHHGARFSLSDGRSMSPLTPKPLDLLVCRVVGEEIEIEF